MARGATIAKRSNDDIDSDDDGVDDDVADSDDDDNESGGKKKSSSEVAAKPPAKKKKKVSSFIDDAAEESGDDEDGNNDDDDDEEGEEDDNNSYIKDGFVVDEEDDDEDDGATAQKKSAADGLEDSDDDDDDDDDDSDAGGRKKGKLRKIRATDILDEDDLLLIEDNRYDDPQAAARIAAKRRADEAEAKARASARAVVASNADDLRKGLFDGDDDDEDDNSNDKARNDSQGTSNQKGGERKQQPKKPIAVERYDEYGMDDFIEDDIGDQDHIRFSDRKSAYDDEDGREVTEDQLNEASEIFGTDYLEFMQDDAPADDDEDDLMGRKSNKFRERGVGVSYGVDSDEEIISEDDEDDDHDDDDEDLFGDADDDGDGGGIDSQQKAEALRLKREKRKLAKAERRRLAYKKKAERRKAQLRRAFEPVQLIENFCTERDDEIRQVDVPERFYDWKVPFLGSDTTNSLNEIEMEQAKWIASHIPELVAEMVLASENPMKEEEEQKNIFLSIANALRFLQKDKLEPCFIKRYRKDYFPNKTVLTKLYDIMDEISEWHRIITARDKVGKLLSSISESSTSHESTGNEELKLRVMRGELAEAVEKMDNTAKQELQVKADLEALRGKNSEDDDGDDLFGNDDDDNAQEEKKKERTRLESLLLTVQSLLDARADKVQQLQGKVQDLEAQLKDPSIASSSSLHASRITKKMCRNFLWNEADYEKYLTAFSDSRHADGRQILDMNSYLNLIKEGNDAIRKKEMPNLLEFKDSSKANDRRRSRRFDRDFYRTCVSEGLRAVCYRFLLAPNRAGIKLEDNLSDPRGFQYSKIMEGEGRIGAKAGDNDEYEDVNAVGDPTKWAAPRIESFTPIEFANDLMSSGDLVLLSSTGGSEPDAGETQDPLRGCRYVAAMELSAEPRIRRHLRTIYRKHAVLTTKPTTKGYEGIDAFHDFYGLHVIRNKPLRDHFPLSEDAISAARLGCSNAEKRDFDKKTKELQRNSCLQYLNVLKAERSGFATVHIHLSILQQDRDWFDMKTEELFSRENQDLDSLTNELERVYLPPDGDTDDWNEERRKVLRFALTNFLLPQFEAEIRRDLLEASIKIGIEVAGEKLRDMAMEGPYRPASILHTENRFLFPTGQLPIVGVCCANDGKDASYLASATARGEISDHLAVPAGQRIEVGKMREKVIMFLIKERPAAVVVGTSGGFSSRLLQRKLNDLVTEAVSRWNNRDIQGEDEDDDAFAERQRSFRQFQPSGYYDEDDDDDEEWKCNVDLINDEVSQLFGRSFRGKKEFPDYATNLKCAISTARYAKDPLGELTYTWSVASDTGVFGTEMLFLNIHPIQQLLPKPLLLRQYERVLLEAVSDVGTNLNEACNVDHLSGYLMFVSGLGPRKAGNLKQAIKKMGDPITRRRDLLEKRLLGPVVYNNAVPFIRIEETDRDHVAHPLDETRLHPDVYLRNNWAVKIAVDALEREDPTSKESAAIKALRDVMDNSRKEIERLFKESKAEWERIYGPTFNIKDWNPRVDVPAEHWADKVEDLDLDTFADMIEQNGHGRWHSHLDMIKWELRMPFADPRKPMEALSGDKLFHLITGESDQSLRPGKEVTGKVVRNGDFGSRVKLEGDIPAFIPLKNLSDEHVESADDYVAANQIVTAVITEVKKDHMTVDMSLKLDDFRKNPSTWPRPQSLWPFDEHFDFNAAQRIEEANNKKREAHIAVLQSALGNKSEDGTKKGGRVVRRACTHPAFKNMKHDEIERLLHDGGLALVGEALIRPSSKSSDSLAVHWVVKEGCIKVIEVLEEDKDTDASIGNVLKIKGEAYSSIDELFGRYIAPMNDFVEELVNHRKFQDTPEDDLDQKLKAEKKSNPKSIPYGLCWMEMHPGYASLRFVASTSARHHAIGINPKGYSWVNNNYPSLDQLLNAFKKNPRGGAAPKVSKPIDTATVTLGAAAPIKLQSKGRWGAKTSVAPPLPPQGAPPAAWNRPAPPAPPVQATAWGAPPQVPVPAASVWGQAPPQPHRPPPPNLPPPPTYGMRPMTAPVPLPRPPPPNMLPPQQEQRLLPPAGPPPMMHPAPPQQPAPGFGAAGGDLQSQGRGRGRGMTLPAWMARG